MKKISNILFKLLPKAFKEWIYWQMVDEIMGEEELKHWYKARRAGYKRKDMCFYYADLQGNSL